MVSARYPGKNVSSVKAHNIQAILMNLLYNEPAYRVQLAREIAVSTTTVTKLVDELISQGIVEERTDEIEGRRSVGRSQNALYLVRDALHAVGIHIGGGIYRIAVVNLRNEIEFHKIGYFEIISSIEEVVDHIARDTNQLLDECGICRESLLGVGVGAPGLVDYQTGMIGYAKNQGWRNAPVGEMLSGRLNLPVIVENNVRAMALGEAFFGAGRDVDSLLFMYGRLGVAAGIVVDRKIYRGINLGAGEIGHTFILHEENEDGSLGTYNTLENLVSAPALLRKAREYAEAYPESQLAGLVDLDNDQDALVYLFTVMKQGDPYAKRMIEKSAEYLGVSIVNAVNFLNPDLILLGGVFSQEKEIYLPIVQKMVKELSFAGLGEKVKIRSTNFGWKAGVLGASCLALANFFYLPSNEISLF